MQSDQHKKGAGLNKGLLLFSVILAVLVVGSLSLKILETRPDTKVSKQKIEKADLEEFRRAVGRMVSRFTVRREHGIPVVHPPAGSDVYLLARNYDWGDFILELEQGRTYRLKLATLDIKHAIVVRELKLMNRIKPGEIKTIVFAPQAVGRFEIICGEWCGPGHAGMRGTLIVVKPETGRAALQHPEH